MTPAGTPVSVAVHGKDAPTANGPAQAVPVEPSGKVQLRPETVPPLTTASLTVTSRSASVPVLVTVNASPVAPAGSTTAAVVLSASLPAVSFLTIVTPGVGNGVTVA